MSKKKDICKWVNNSDGYYDTSCGKAFVMTNEEGLERNGFRFCPYCGRRIVEGVVA